ncbi:flagellar biosynthetic protein FliO [Calderihabitans maritimus]|uniref:Flagellar biosynthetic protein FliO n=1 Tax=Calderihabitans maritimus TaxID=1246530 RepID=A0A1Z5HTR4_9FIRM|nr:flagellar biosynthetic protein FliO [Calderihabitans maritimus]GAW92929.1 flagellar biosynthetic protein FliO [Calderihabitans maritimus]
MGSDFFGALVRLVISLPLVLLMMYLVLRYGLGRPRLSAQGKSLELVDQIMLSPKVVVSVVRVADKFLIIATGEGNVTVLGELEDYPVTGPPGGSKIGGDLSWLPPWAERWWHKLSANRRKKKDDR